jgi:MFS superfamily sulfate permease-like transporter
MLLNTIAIEVATEREANLDRELKWHGIANLLIAALGVTLASRP